MGQQGRAGRTHLPGSQAAATEQMPTRLNLYILIALCTDLAELECGVHGPVQLQLLLAGEKVGRVAGIQVGPQDRSPKPLCQPQILASSRVCAQPPPICILCHEASSLGSTLEVARLRH